MQVQTFEIPGLKLLVPKRFEDARGYFFTTWNDQLFQERVDRFTFVQDNQSLSLKKGTVRGLHFQKPPYAQGKLVRVLRGAIFDVAVDVRQASPTYGRHVAVTLDSVNGTQIWIPPGFLHGFCTLEDNTEIHYKVTACYSPSHDAGVLWNDPDLAIDWPVKPENAILSEKDLVHPRLRDLPRVFASNG